MAAITEDRDPGDVEVWQIANLTAEAHPIRLHLVMFRILDRTPIAAEVSAANREAWVAGGKADPAPDPLDRAAGAAYRPYQWETGWKGTVIMNPGEVTRIAAFFDLPRLRVWHCHILEHEHNEMMRPCRVME